MCCSASDLYLSLVIFSNTALAFVFAQMAIVRWSPSDGTSYVRFPVSASWCHCVWSSFLLSSLSLSLFIVSAHPMPNVLLSTHFLYLLNRPRHVHILFTEPGICVTENSVKTTAMPNLKSIRTSVCGLSQKNKHLCHCHGRPQKREFDPPKSCHPMIHVHTWLGGGSIVVLWCCKRNKIRSLFRVRVRICVCAHLLLKRGKGSKRRQTD